MVIIQPSSSIAVPSSSNWPVPVRCPSYMGKEMKRIDVTQGLLNLLPAQKWYPEKKLTRMCEHR